MHCVSRLDLKYREQKKKHRRTNTNGIKDALPRFLIGKFTRILTQNRIQL